MIDTIPASYWPGSRADLAITSGSVGSSVRTHSGTSRPVRQRDARLADVPVDEPAERCGRVRVRRGERGVRRLLGRDVLEPRVARAAEEARRLEQERRLARDERAEAADERGVRHVLGPLDPQRLRRQPQASQAVGVGERHRAEEADAALSIRSAAAIPVIRDIWAFQPSTGSGARNCSP